MFSRFVPALDISGCLGTGLTDRMAIPGFREHGWSPRLSAFSGLQVIGAGMTAITSGMKATGDRTSGSTAASTTVSVTPAWDITAATGAVEISFTTAQSQT